MTSTRLKDCGARTVPQPLMGCWRRNWIRFGDDGELQSNVAVIWLQTASGMCDLRIDPDRPPAQTDSSCGDTIVDINTEPMVTADWIDGDHGFAQQAVSSFPEKGWLNWESPIIMYEHAPSGAYVEEWERLPRSSGRVAHFRATNTPTRNNLYIAGSHMIHARERAAGEPIHEFSYGVRLSPPTIDPSGDEIVIEMSTLPDRQGELMDLDADWQLVSCRRI